MIEIKTIGVWGFEGALHGMRMPFESFDKSDSDTAKYVHECDDGCPYRNRCDIDDYYYCHEYGIGSNDMALCKKLIKGGSEHRKFMRMITVYLDITAPLYWWKEFDTYKVGTVANSCSTMHKIHAKEFTREDFSSEHVMCLCEKETPVMYHPSGNTALAPIDVLDITIMMLNKARDLYLQTKDKQYWWQLIQLLPSSYNQKRTVMLNYEVLANMFAARCNHKLDEWKTLCEWMRTLPYSELITNER